MHMHTRVCQTESMRKGLDNVLVHSSSPLHCAKSPAATLAACTDSTAAPAASKPASESGEGTSLQGADAGEDAKASLQEADDGEENEDAESRVDERVRAVKREKTQLKVTLCEAEERRVQALLALLPPDAEGSSPTRAIDLDRVEDSEDPLSNVELAVERRDPELRRRAEAVLQSLREAVEVWCVKAENTRVWRQHALHRTESGDFFFGDDEARPVTLAQLAGLAEMRALVLDCDMVARDKDRNYELWSSSPPSEPAAAKPSATVDPSSGSSAGAAPSTTTLVTTPVAVRGQLVARVEAAMQTARKGQKEAAADPFLCEMLTGATDGATALAALQRFCDPVDASALGSVRNGMYKEQTGMTLKGANAQKGPPADALWPGGRDEPPEGFVLLVPGFGNKGAETTLRKLFWLRVGVALARCGLARAMALGRCMATVGSTDNSLVLFMCAPTPFLT